MNLNIVILGGNLTRDPALKETNSGTAICEFGLAVNRKWKGRDGEKREEVCFVDITAFGHTANAAAKYLSKGSSAIVEGRLQFDQWEDRQTGQKRSKLKVIADRVHFVGGQRSGESRSNERRSEPEPAGVGSGSAQYGGNGPPPNDEVPFSLAWLLVGLPAVNELWRLVA